MGDASPRENLRPRRVDRRVRPARAGLGAHGSARPLVAGAADPGGRGRRPVGDAGARRRLHPRERDGGDRDRARAGAAVAARARSLDRPRPEPRRRRRGHAAERARRRPQPELPVAVAADERRLRVGPATAVGARGSHRARADPAAASASDRVVPPAPRHGLGVRRRPADREGVRARLRAAVPPDAAARRQRDLVAEQHAARHDRVRSGAAGGPAVARSGRSATSPRSSRRRRLPRTRRATRAARCRRRSAPPRPC